VVSSLQGVSYRPGALAWAVELKTQKVSYFGISKPQQQEPFPFDPQRFVVGVFVGEEKEVETEADRRARYKISKK
jgi:hypothetical protein